MRQEKTNLHAGYSHRDNNYPVHVHTHTHTHLERVLFFPSLSPFPSSSEQGRSLLFHYSRFSFSSSLSFFVISFPFPPTSLSEIDRTKIFFYFVSLLLYLDPSFSKRSQRYPSTRARNKGVRISIRKIAKGVSRVGAAAKNRPREIHGAISIAPHPAYVPDEIVK